jgi:hypothetical protein
MSRKELFAALFWPVALAGSLASAFPSRAADRSLEYAIKATFLYKFGPYVEWPAGSFERSSSPFNVCMVGDGPYNAQIEQAVTGQRVGEHPIVVRHLSSAGAHSNCQVMFVSGSPEQSADETIEAVRGTPTLTVTDSTIGHTTGIVHFVIVGDHVSFDIDTGEAARNHLVISSKLLALAHAVKAGVTR